jgi:hypothetical protein
MEPEEHYFLTTTEISKRTGYLSGHPIAYPIVKLSEVYANPDEVMRCIHASTARIATAAYEQCMQDMEHVHKSMHEMMCSFEEMCKQHNHMFDTLHHSIRELEQLKCLYEKHHPECEEEFAKCIMVKKNLMYRHRIFAEEIGHCMSACALQQEIAKVKDSFDNTTKHLMERTELLKYVISDTEC